MEKGLGIEVEFTGVRREQVANALANLFHGKIERVLDDSCDSPYVYHRCIEQNGNAWLVVRDRSIKPQIYACNSKCTEWLYGRYDVIDLDRCYEEYMCELVTPVLNSSTLQTLFSVIDIVKSQGGITNETCGIHVHIDKPNSLEELIILYKRFLSEQEKIVSDWKIPECRLTRYCRLFQNADFIDGSISSESEFLDWLYEVHADEGNKKSLRYYALNFYSLIQHGTIEFRLFNSELDRVYIAKVLDWVLHFAYAPTDYNNYIRVLGSIIMNEIK